MIRRAAALIACLLAFAAEAKDVKVGSTLLVLTAPADYCELNPDEVSDAPIIEAVEGAIGHIGNRLLAMSAECRQLDDLRAGRRRLLDNFAQLQTLIRLESNPPLARARDVIAVACDRMRAPGGQGDIGADINMRAEQAVQEINTGETRYLGVVAEEPLACYAALVQRFKTEFGTDKTQVGVYFASAIKGRIVNHYLYGPYVGAATVTDMLARQKANFGQLQAANPD